MTVTKSKHYEVKRIFIGSPGDVPKERKIFSDIIKRVNKIKANSLSVHLEAIGWEDTLPGKGRPRPQSNINEDLLKCHLIIMLLWNRWGSNTGKYSSGFEEEYELADSNSKEIWLFFREVRKEMLADPGDQLKKVIEFRDRMEKERKYFFIPYKDEKDWRIKLEEYLCYWLDKIGPAPPSGKLPEAPPGFQGLRDATEYKVNLSKLDAEVDDFISKQVENANELANQANEFANEGRISKAEEYYSKALSISNDPNIINKFGQFLFRIGDVDRAEEKFDMLMEIAESTKNKDLKSIAFNNLGRIYQIKGDIAKSEELVNKSLAIDKELGNKEGMAAAYGNLGIVKATRGKQEEAKNLFNKSLAIDKELGNKEGMASVYGNLGVLKKTQGDLEGAEKLHEKALELNKELGRKEGMANTYGNLANIKRAQGELENAKILLTKTLKICESLGNADNINKAKTLINQLEDEIKNKNK